MVSAVTFALRSSGALTLFEGTSLLFRSCTLCSMFFDDAHSTFCSSTKTEPWLKIGVDNNWKQPDWKFICIPKRCARFYQKWANIFEQSSSVNRTVKYVLPCCAIYTCTSHIALPLPKKCTKCVLFVYIFILFPIETSDTQLGVPFWISIFFTESNERLSAKNDNGRLFCQWFTIVIHVSKRLSSVNPSQKLACDK